MRRIGLVCAFTVSLAGLSLIGCSKEPPAPSEPAPPPSADGRPATSSPRAAALLSLTGATETSTGLGEGAFFSADLPEPSPEQKCESGLLDALDWMARRNYPKALA